MGRSIRIVYGLCGVVLASACSGGSGGSAAGGADAGRPGVDATVDPVGARDASTAPSEENPGQAVDPTAQTDITGVYVAPGEDFARDLDALLAYERTTLGALECPGLLSAASCGNGTCEGAEDASTCPADCVSHLVGAYNDLPICPSYQTIVTPKSVEEVVDAVKTALFAGQRVRAVGARHSASDAICGDGLVLDMSKFANVNNTRIEGDVAYVEPGVRMVDLGDFLYEKGLGIGFSHLGFRGVTVAGAMGTAAHGSSPVHNNTVSHRVASMTMVMADGKVRTFTQENTSEDLWRAITAHLGLFGVVVEVGLRVEPSFQLDTKISVHSEAELLESPGALGLLEGCDWGQFNWFPHERKVMRWCGKKTSAPAIPNVNNTLLDPGVSPDLTGIAKAGFHAGSCGDELNALLEQTRVQGLLDNPPILIKKSDGSSERTTAATGPAHRMVSADLIDLSQNKYFQMDWEVAVPQQFIQDTLRTARKVFDAHNVSLPGVGVFVRFGLIEKGSWFSYHSAGKHFAEGQTAMFFETPVAVPTGYTPQQLKDYLHIYEQLTGLLVKHFGARAHWGKNLGPIFDLQHIVGTYEGRTEKMNAAVAALDPYGVFANTFARKIGIRWPKEGEDFSQVLAGNQCGCGISAEPVCEYRSKRTFASACRAACEGVPSSALLDGACQKFVWDTCSLLDARTCVWDAKAKERTATVEPLVRY